MAKQRISIRLGRIIAQKRVARDLSQEQLAHKAGIHRTYVGMIERGERNISVINLLRVATALELQPGELLDSLGTVLPADPNTLK